MFAKLSYRAVTTSSDSCLKFPTGKPRSQCLAIASPGGPSQAVAEFSVEVLGKGSFLESTSCSWTMMRAVRVSTPAPKAHTQPRLLRQGPCERRRSVFSSMILLAPSRWCTVCEAETLRTVAQPVPGPCSPYNECSTTRGYL